MEKCLDISQSNVLADKAYGTGEILDYIQHQDSEYTKANISGFPKGFLWGSSTNAQQFEGGWNEGGKGVSIAGTRAIPMETITASNFDDFKIASDLYHRFPEDIANCGKMRFFIYRLLCRGRVFSQMGTTSSPASFYCYKKVIASNGSDLSND